MSNSAIWNTLGRKAMEGDCEALGNLLESYRPQLKLIAGKSLSPRLRVKADVSDVVQETFEDACEDFGRSAVSNRRQFWSWLKSILLRRVCDVHRTYVSSLKRCLEREEAGQEVTETLLKEQSTASETAMRIESAEKLTASISQLPKPYRLVIELRFLHGLSCEEIAIQIERSPNAVRMLVNRAIARLRTVLAAEL